MGRPQITKVLVIRHGETVWNAVGRQQGHLDTDLSELGLAQARAIGEALAGKAVDVLYSSDLGRAMQTAAIIARLLGLEIRREVGLRERHLGILQGLTMEEFRLRHPEEYASFTAGDEKWVIPGGESVRQRHERSVACARDLANRHPGQCLAVVTHGGVLESIFRHAVGLPLKSPRHFSLFNASISTFSVSDGKWKLDRWGDTYHLRGLGANDDW